MAEALSGSARRVQQALAAAGIEARVDERLVSSHLGTEIGKADADFVRSTTGYAIGGVPPLGHYGLVIPISTSPPKK